MGETGTRPAKEYYSETGVLSEKLNSDTPGLGELDVLDVSSARMLR
jgi:hypothetical protein